MISLATALQNPALFGNAFSGASWWSWHAVAKIISGEPLDVMLTPPSRTPFLRG
jgi:hypothetical protein